VGVSGSSRIERSGGTGSMPWPLGLLAVILSLWMMRRRRRELSLAGNRWLILALLWVTVAGISACGKGGGLLGAGSTDPLPVSSLTPPGTYTVTVTAAAGGLQKSVNLSLLVQ
jgi:hypothetical protein